MPKRIPISAAKQIANEHDCRQVIVLAWDGDLTHVVTYGRSEEDCDQAAQGGDKLKSALGWPATANALPSRVKSANARAEAAEAEAAALRERVATLEGALRKRIEWHKCSCPEPCDDYWIFPGGCSSRYAEDYRNLLAALATQEQASAASEPQPDADGWITWAGGECPVPAGKQTLMRFRSGYECRTYGPQSWRWSHNGGLNDIIAYHILPEETK